MNSELEKARVGLPKDGVLYRWTIEDRIPPSASELAMMRREALKPGEAGTTNRRLVAILDRGEWPVLQQRLWVFGERAWRLALEPTYNMERWTDSAVNGSDGWRMGLDHIDVLDPDRPRPGYDNSAIFYSGMSEIATFRFGGLDAASRQGITTVDHFAVRPSGDDLWTIEMVSPNGAFRYVFTGKWRTDEARLEMRDLALLPTKESAKPSRISFLDWSFDEVIGACVAHRVEHRKGGSQLTRVVALQPAEHIPKDQRSAILRTPRAGAEDAVRGKLAIVIVNERRGDMTTSTFLGEGGEIVKTASGVDPNMKNAALLNRTGRWLAAGATCVAAVGWWAVRSRRNRALKQRSLA